MGMYAGHFDFRHSLIWTIPDAFSAPECAEIVRSVENAEWLAATVNREEGRRVDQRVRDNTVAIVRNPNLAEDLYRRIRPHVPNSMNAETHGNARADLVPVGVFLPLRVYRYEVGQHFGLHEDQSYFGPNGEVSLLTLLVYLNEDFDGGETEFPEQNQIIQPRTGTILLFQHRVLHAGNRIVRGTKMVLRTDVLFKRT